MRLPESATKTGDYIRPSVNDGNSSQKRLDPKISANLIANSECYRKIPCATETRNCFCSNGEF